MKNNEWPKQPTMEELNRRAKNGRNKGEKGNSGFIRQFLIEDVKKSLKTTFRNNKMNFADTDDYMKRTISKKPAHK